jgi:uncharacterized repeat protein (TIGR02543 family)
MNDSIIAAQSSVLLYDLSRFYLAVGVTVGAVNNIAAVNVSEEHSGDGGTSLWLGGQGLLADGESAGVEWSVTGSGVISFDWRVSSEKDYDFLSFCVEGAPATNSISGTTAGWSRVFAAVGGGGEERHTFRWVYSKDPVGDFVGQDCGWLDSIVWSPFYTLTVNGGSGGGSFTNGALLVISAAAPPAWNRFDRWTGDTNGVADVYSASTTLSMPGTEASVTATYTPILYPLQVGLGSGSGMYPYGTSVEITAEAYEGKRFYRWTGDVDSVSDVTSATATVVMVGRTLNVPATYCTHLTVENGSGGGWHPEGTAVNVAADPAPLYMDFEKWTGDAALLLDDATSRAASLTMPTHSASLMARYHDSVSRALGCYGRDFSVAGVDGGVSVDGMAGSHSGTPAVKLGGSGLIPDNGSVSLDMTVSGGGEISFMWRVSSESDSDFLLFFVDGQAVASISGTKGGWIAFTNRVGGVASTHTLSWRYQKNGSFASSLDAGWVDDIVWAADQPEPFIISNLWTSVDGDGVMSVAFDGMRGVAYTLCTNAEPGVSGWTAVTAPLATVGETNGLFRFETSLALPPLQSNCACRVVAGNPFAVSIDPAGGAVGLEEVSVLFGTAYGELPLVFRSGYTFGGWWTEAEGGSLVAASTEVGTGVEHTLFAKWIPNVYRVTFDVAGGAVAPEPIQVTFGSTYGPMPEPSRAGYAFSGWRTWMNGVSVGIEVGLAVGIAEDHTLTAAWTARDYTVSFDVQGGVVDPVGKTVTYGASYGVLPDPFRAGYEFRGWWTQAAGVGDLVTEATAVAVAGAHALYASWSAIVMTVTFDALGGAVAPGTKSVAYDSAYGALPRPSKAGFTFEGWWTDYGGAGAKVEESSVVGVSADHIVYAKWAAAVLTVTFDGNGGTVDPAQKQVTFGSAYGTLPSPELRGYLFGGWRLGGEGGQPVAEGAVVTAVSDHTLVAAWASGVFVVTFDAAGGSVDPTNKPVTFGDAYGPLPTPYLRGCTFSGWTVVTNGVVVPVTSNTVVMVAADHALLGSWLTNAYEVCFDADGGSVDPLKKDVHFGSDYGVLPVPVLAGHAFVGWTAATNAPWAFVKSSSVVTSDFNHTLYAIYNRPPSFTKRTPAADPSFVTEGASVAFSVTASDGTDPDAAKRGMSNVVWFVDGAQVLEAKTGAPGAVTSTYTLRTATNTVVGVASRQLSVRAVAADLQGGVSETLWTLPVNNRQAAQTLTFPAIPQKANGDPDFAAGSVASSGLPVGYSSSDPSVVSIVDGSLHITGAGTAVITASQPGTFDFKAATPVKQTLTVKARLTCDVQGGGGTITGAGLYLPGTKVSLTAKPSAGYTFLRWEDGSQAASRSLTMPNSNATVSAWFGPTSGVQRPVIGDPDAGRAMVGVPYALPLDIQSDSLPTVTVSGLPAGLSYNVSAKVITGVPTVAVSGKIFMVTAKNVSGIPATRSFALSVDPLKAAAQGTFTGIALEAAGDDTETVKGLLTMTVTPAGAINAKVTAQAGSYSFTGVSWDSASNGVFRATMRTAKGETLKLALDTGASWNAISLEGTLSGGAFGSSVVTVQGLRNAFLAKTAPDYAAATSALARFKGYYTVALPPGALSEAGAAGNAPQGSGYIALTVKDGGAVTLSGKLADGTALSGATTLILLDAGSLDEGAYVPLLFPLYSSRGCFSGVLQLAPAVSANPADNAAEPAGSFVRVWSYPGKAPAASPAQTEDRFAMSLGMIGGYYNSVADLRAYYSNAWFEAQGPSVSNTYVSGTYKTTVGAVQSALPEVRLTFDPKTGAVSLPAGKGPAYDRGAGAYVYAPTNPAAATISAAKATGIFTGKFNLYYEYLDQKGVPKLTTVPVSHEGVLTPVRANADDPSGWGFYLVPDTWKSPDVKPVAYPLKRSYGVEIRNQN